MQREGAGQREPTRESVREAALTLFAERGYHGTPLRSIAERIGIRTPSLYNHIDPKQELLRGIVLETTELVWAEYGAAVATAADAVGRLRRAVEVYALRHATHPREALIVNRDAPAWPSRPARR